MRRSPKWNFCRLLRTKLEGRGSKKEKASLSPPPLSFFSFFENGSLERNCEHDSSSSSIHPPPPTHNGKRWKKVVQYSSTVVQYSIPSK